MPHTAHDGVESLAAVLDSILKPLHFAARDNGINIEKVRNLALHVSAQAERASALAPDAGTQSRLQAVSEAFREFDAHAPERKKQIVAESLARIEHIRHSAEAPGAHSDTAIPQTQDLIDFFLVPVHGLKGVGPATAEKLARLSITTVEDLLYCIPRCYEDRRLVTNIGGTDPGRAATVRGTVRTVRSAMLSRTTRLFEIIVDDGTGSITAKWFRIPGAYQALLSKKFPPGTAVRLSGNVASFRFQREMHHPDISALDNEQDHAIAPGIIPVYPLTEGLARHTMRMLLHQVLQSSGPLLADYMPPSVLKENSLVSLGDALTNIHQPPKNASFDQLSRTGTPWHRRIIFDELFLLQLVLAMRRRGVSLESGIGFAASADTLDPLLAGLPFTLTSAQLRALHEIMSDMQKPHPMNRLIQGDVGCGKTVVALLACMIASANGYQSAIMAPTEILAAQHYATACDLFGCTAPVVFLSSSISKSMRAEALHAIRCGQARIIIGTHALIQDAVLFDRLGLIVVDEQHRFGVLQRAELRRKGQHPDVLVMTATPIPRTLGLTVYGDLDLSIIDELPPGRTPAETRVYNESRRAEVYRIIGEAINRGGQVFIVYPLVQESEKVDLMDATRMATHLRQDIFPGLRIGLAHGRLSAPEKEAVMRDFKHKRLHILVATTVVEVGIDVPNASLMVIEHAERFGLSQLHQLRGRVGRGSARSMCILLAQHAASPEARRRLQVMEQTHDGFAIAEADFNLRGPGEFLGTRQSGEPDFRLAHLGRDVRILHAARKSAFELIERDPRLTGAGHGGIRAMLLHRWKGHLELAGIG